MDRTFSKQIAIVGMGCRFPDAPDLSAYAKLLYEGRCAIRELPAHRFNQRRYYDPEIGAPGKSYCKIGGCIADTPFDFARLGLSADFAAALDPAHRWALDVAWDSFADAGLAVSDLCGSNAAVVLGHARGSMSAADQAFAAAMEELVEPLDALETLAEAERRLIREAAVTKVRARYSAARRDGSPGPVTSAIAGLISACFGLTGRHMVVDAACASSLAALDVACRALRQGSVDLALAGGVSFSQEASVILFAQSRALSGQGSYPFDARASGFVSSDGVGMVVLERLDDALRNGRRIYGVVSGIGASCDGKGKGMWAPRREGQVLAIERALAVAGADAANIGYVEAHGTSTALGDATEVAALSTALAARLPPGTTIPIGSVKGNIGHAREAAGIAGLIKVLIALERELIPPSIGYERPNPEIDWERTPFRHTGKALPWPRGARPRLGAVNSFGIGGLNYQLLVEDPPAAGATGSAAVGRVRASFEPVAIVGMGAVLPAGRTLAQIWAKLSQGESALSAVPRERWPEEHYFVPGGRAVPYKTYAKTGGFVVGYEPDWRRYKMPPALVASNDPLQFMLLDSALDALADAAIELESSDRRRIAVVIGSEFGSDYALALTVALRVPEVSEAVAEALRERGVAAERARELVHAFAERLQQRLVRINEDSSGSSSASTLASRIAKTLDLQGPALALDAACASSLASLEVACEMLRDGVVDLVLYGGGDRSLRAQRFETYAAAGTLSAQDRPRPYAHGADGFVPAEGAGICVLKRLADARAAGDRIYAIVRAVGSASDGLIKGVYEPSAKGLALALRRTYAAADLDPATLTFLEGDGTGTAAASTSELAALREAGVLERRSSSLLLGSIKANLGHAQGAAGVAAVIKTALALHHGFVPPLSGCEVQDLGPGIELNETLTPLAAGARAGVNALGLAGISYHVLLESAAVAEPAREPLLLRARDRAALGRRLGALLQGGGARAGSSHGQGPLALGIPACELPAGLEAAAAALGSSERESLLKNRGVALFEKPLEGPTCFLFAGQGSAYPGMLRELLPHYPAAQARLAELDRVCREQGVGPVSRVMWGDGAELDQVLWSQLTVLAADLLLAEVALTHGLVPDLVSAHSYGDYPAMVFSGVITLEQAVRLTLVRCRLIEERAIAGAMVSLFAERDRVEALLPGLTGAAFVSNVNSPTQIVVSCEERCVPGLIERAAAARIEARRLSVPRPFHSPLMRQAADAFAEEVARIDFRAPELPFLASMTNGEAADPARLPEALAEQLVRPVEFVAQIERAYAVGARRFLEIGPKNVLSRLVLEILGQRPALAVSLDDRKRPGIAAVERALSALRASEPAPSDHAASGLFSQEQWTKLSGQSGFEEFWQDARPELRALAVRWFERPARRPELEKLLRDEAPAPGRVQFFDVTERRRPAATVQVEAKEPAQAVSPEHDEVKAFLLAQVLELTGYPADLIDFAADMEADLGIDTVKQAQIFGRLRERYDLATDDRLALSDFPTLGHVLAYVKSAVAGAPPAAPSPVVTSPVAKAAGTALQPPADVALLELEGEPFAMGLRHGREQRLAIARLIEAYESYLGKEGIRHEALQQALSSPEAYFDETALEEIRGLAEGSALPFRHLLAYNLDSALFPEYGAGCAQAGLAGKDQVLHAANEDSPLSLLLGDALSRIIQLRRPARGKPHLLFSHAGQVGGVNGVAATGLFVTSAVLLDRSRKGRDQGLIHPLLVRKLLENCETAEEARALARGQRRAGSWSVLLSHCRDMRLSSFEYDGERFLEATDLRRHLTANHSVLLGEGELGQPVHSRHRLERLGELIDAEPETMAAATLKRVLLDRFDRGRGRVVTHRTMNTVHRVDNVMSLVAEPALNRLSYTHRAGADDAAAEWRELELTDLFRSASSLQKLAITRLGEEPAATVMTRYVLRTEVEPLVITRESSYRPERVLIVGDGELAGSLDQELAARGAEILRLALEDDPALLEQKAGAIFESGSLPDVVLLSGLERGAPARVIEGPYALLQQWARRLSGDEPRTLSAVTALGGALGQLNGVEAVWEGGAVLGLLKALRQEFPGLRGVLLDSELREQPAVLASALLRELDASERSALEVGLLRGARRVLRLFPVEPRFDGERLAALRGVRSALVTGGARGISAEVALRLAQAGVRRLHLLGRTPLDPRAEAWRTLDATGLQAVKRDLMAELFPQRGAVSALDFQRAAELVDKSREIDKNLGRLRALGVHASYHAVDVADRAALADVLARIREEGPIKLVVHGAGVEHSRSFVTKTRAELQATLAPKVQGALNIFSLLDADELEWFVAFSSVSGRFGGQGQADYSLASELLAQLVAAHGRSRPRCRTLTLDWPAWDEVGMAARPAIHALLEAAGQDFMSVQEGGDHFMAELVSAAPEREVVFAGGLDVLDRDHLLSSPVALSELRPRAATASSLPLIDVLLRSSADEALCECHLDAEADAFLRQHLVLGKPTLPAVVSLELLAETAQLLSPDPGVVLENVRIQAPLKLRPDARLPLTCSARRETAGLSLLLSADVLGSDGRLLTAARPFVTARARVEPPGALSERARALPRRVIDGTSLPARYPDANGANPSGVFHGQVFRSLLAVVVASEGNWHAATLHGLDDAALRARCPLPWFVPAATLDGCLQACSVVARVRWGALALPAGFDALWLGRPLRAGERCELMIAEVARDETSISFDFHLLGEDGETIAYAERYVANFLKGSSG